MRTHIDLFSGIGGFTFAASWCGIETIAFCEIDRRCRDFLAKTWPGIPTHDDVRTFDGRQYAGAWLITAGVPCQPASRAGKQRGRDDDRWLWPQTIRVLSEVRPTWALFENPLGIGDVGLAGILAEMEGLGYEVRVFGIPACAVGAPHRRERYWIVANDLAHTEGGIERAGLCAAEPGEIRGRRFGYGSRGFWDNFVWLPCGDKKVRRAPDDYFGLVDGLHRSILAALGNSIVPQVAAKIIAAMIEAERETR